MKLRFKRAWVAWATAAAIGGGAAGCNGQQPPIVCTVQGLVWVATYHPKAKTSCPLKYGEQLGIEEFGPVNGDDHVTIKPSTLAALDERDPDHLPYSIGSLPQKPGSDDFCAVPSLTVAEKKAPADPGQSLGAVDISYRWSNVRILTLPGAAGTQLVADLQYTENGCAAEYEAWALWPGDVSCANDGGRPDDSLCQTASTLNHDFDTVCDPTLLLCVPARRPPSFH